MSSNVNLTNTFFRVKALERASSTARFQRSGGGAVVYGGLYLPSLQKGLSGRFENQPLELAYQRYSYRQRQKSFIVVNGVDVALKIIAVVLISIHYYGASLTTNKSFSCSTDSLLSFNSSSECLNKSTTSGVTLAHSHGVYPTETVTWTSCLILVNILLCLLASCWKCFANNYLHWAALATWLLMNLQGKLKAYRKMIPFYTMEHSMAYSQKTLTRLIPNDLQTR
jgi:hypothetical protein